MNDKHMYGPTSHFGMFDSGVGGLTVLQEMQKALPGSSFTYFGDSARFPYGAKSQETISRYSEENSRFLIQKGVEAIIVACYTASSFSLAHLRKVLRTPVFGVIEPAAERVYTITQTKRIGIIGTKGTIQAGTCQNEIQCRLSDAHIFAIPCPLLATLIEENYPNIAITRLILQEYLAPLKENDIDTLVLACTHYPMLSHLIQEEMGDHVQLVNPGKVLADEIKKLQQVNGDTIQTIEKGTTHFFVSDDEVRFQSIGERFLGCTIPHVELIKL